MFKNFNISFFGFTFVFMTIKNGSNTFLIGLAVYWQSCGLTSPMLTVGLMQHIRVCNSYLSVEFYPKWNINSCPIQYDNIGKSSDVISKELTQTN